jgi:CRISPR system Cascade subunit CasD
MPDHLILQLEAPLMSFGDTMIDATGPTRDLPILSAVTGLIANALGWRRGERERHQTLQERLVMGARLDRPGTELRDFQTAQLAKSDEGWTTHGRPEGRAGGANTYNSPHIRERFYRADALVNVAMRLEPAADAPDLDAIEAALEMPARPLFIGRKPCLPSTPIKAGRIDAATTLDALKRWPLAESSGNAKVVRLIIPARDMAAPYGSRPIRVADQRNWISGVHAGESELCLLHIERTQFQRPESMTEVIS